MSNVAERNQEYEDSINKGKREYLNFFVEDFIQELEGLERMIPNANESSLILLSWVRDKLQRLHEDYDADL